MTLFPVIISLVLTVFGISGCTFTRFEAAPAPKVAVQSRVPQEVSVQEGITAAPVAAASADEPLAQPLLALIERQDIQEEFLFAPISKTAVEKAKAAPRRMSGPAPVSKANPAAAEADDAAALHRAPGPRADRRLLDLLEKDIDKAVERPKERRRLEFSREVRENPKVRYFIDYFSRAGRVHFEKVLARSGRYMPMISQVLSEEGLPEELAYLALIESAFTVKATSPEGAAGLWQFVPGTARLYGLRIDAWIDERRDPEKSTRAAAAYLKDLHAYFGRWFLATAAYNAGQGAIDRAMQRSGATDFWTLRRKAQLSDETSNFVPKFIAAAIIATNPETYGFSDVEFEAPIAFDEVEINRPLRLGTIAEMTDCQVAEVLDLNPSLRGRSTPPGDDSFYLKLPLGKGSAFAEAYRAGTDKALAKLPSAMHEVRRGETLNSIARRYGQRVQALMELNGLKNSHLRIGQKLRIGAEGFRGGAR